MKRMGRMAAFALLCALLAAAPWAIRKAQVDVSERIRPKDTRWQGVISVGFVPTFAMESAGGWLKACASAFAKEYDNVQVSVREMTKAGVQAGSAAQTLPDVLVFGENVFGDEERQDLFEREGAVPVAAGEYLLLGNRAMLEKAGWSSDMDAEQTLQLMQAQNLIIAVPKRDYADPMAALRRMGDVPESSIKQDIYARVWPDFVLEEKYALYVATQREVRRMETLRSAGRGFETVEYRFTDAAGKGERLLCALVQEQLTPRTDRAVRAPWCEAFGAYLLEEAQQAALETVGLLPVP